MPFFLSSGHRSTGGIQPQDRTTTAFENKLGVIVAIGFAVVVFGGSLAWAAWELHSHWPW